MQKQSKQASKIKSETKTKASKTASKAKPASKQAKQTQKQTVKSNVKFGYDPQEVAFSVDQFSGGLKSVVEAILIAATEPVLPKKLANVLAVSEEEINIVLTQLQADYESQNRAFELKSFDGHWRYYSKPEYGEAVTKFITGNAETKLSIAALETLAIIAYKQPVSRYEISQIRGVNVDGVMRTLLQRGFIELHNSDKTAEQFAGRYITTPLFLEKMGISSLAELEPLAPFLPDDISLIPQFDDIRKSNKQTKSEEAGE